MGPRPNAPELPAGGQVMRGHEDLVADAEGDIDSFPVGEWRARGIAVFLVEFLQRALHHRLLPEDLATHAVETQQDAIPGSRISGDRVHTIAPNDR